MPTDCTCTPTVNPFPWLPGTAIIVDRECPVHGNVAENVTENVPWITNVILELDDNEPGKCRRKCHKVKGFIL